MYTIFLSNDFVTIKSLRDLYLYLYPVVNIPMFTNSILNKEYTCLKKVVD